MHCNNCEKEVPDFAKFCEYCGAKIDFNSKKYCSKCGNEVSIGSKFCNSCGNNLTGQDGSNIDKENNISTSTKIRKGKGIYYKDVTQHIYGFLINKKMEAQIIEEHDKCIVQGKDKGGLFANISGQGKAITIQFIKRNNDLEFKIGGAKWLDKAAGAAIGILIFWPAFFTTIGGMYRQNKLFQAIENEVNKYLDSCRNEPASGSFTQEGTALELWARTQPK
jgi:hypothetical protein